MAKSPSTKTSPVDAEGSGEVVSAKLVRTATDQPQGLFRRVLYSRKAVLAILFFVTLFLGIPLLWMNPRFSTAERWLWAMVVVIYSCVLFALTGWVVVWSWSRVSEVL